MDRKEALIFLDLPEDASDKEFRKKLEEKLGYYERLSEKAPSAFLRRLNSMHLLKTRVIQKDIASFLAEPIYIPVELAPVGSELSGINDSHLLSTMPIIVTTQSRMSVRKIEKSEPAAFLIRHTENLSIKPFPLYIGKNFIGRKNHPTIKPFIALEDDEYVSRIHAMIYVDESDASLSYIDDSVVSNDGKPSKNGTFVNGNKQRVKSMAVLKENDTIQIGETKFIFRLNQNNITSIVEEIEDRDYMHTVVIRR